MDYRMAGVSLSREGRRYPHARLFILKRIQCFNPRKMFGPGIALRILGFYLSRHGRRGFSRKPSMTREILNAKGGPPV